jgi:hypothetical protein
VAHSENVVLAMEGPKGNLNEHCGMKDTHVDVQGVLFCDTPTMTFQETEAEEWAAAVTVTGPSGWSSEDPRVAKPSCVTVL